MQWLHPSEALDSRTSGHVIARERSKRAGYASTVKFIVTTVIE
jgi:hypothetical protein